MTFDLSGRLKLMLDKAKLSPTSVSINTNRMSGEALSNKCFIMPQALNDYKTKSFLWLKCSIAKITNVFSELHMLGLYAQWISLNPIRPGLFSRSPGLGGLRGPDAKNQG